MDDFIVYGDTFVEALTNLDNVLQCCEKNQLSLSHEKCFMMVEEGIVLGHHILAKGIKVDQNKIEVIKQLPSPKNQIDIRIFLGHAGYYRRFIKNFSRIAAPMFSLLTKDADFSWTKDCQSAFETIKEKLTITPVLRGPNWTLPFHIQTDSSNESIGAVLGQKEEGEGMHAIYYISKNITPAEKKKKKKLYHN